MGLCTLAQVKEYNDITATTNDTLLTNLITRVSKEIETYCDRIFESASYTEYHNGGGNDKFFTNQYPIITGSGIEVWDDIDWEWGSGDLIDSDDYMVTDNLYIQLKSLIFVAGINNVKISYTAGYSTIPTDLTQVCIEEVSRTFKKRKHIEIASKSLPDGSVSYVVESFLPKTITILNHYKRKYIC